MDNARQGLLISGDLFFTSKVSSTAASLGLKMDTAESSEEATRRIADSDYACILVDVTLPGIDLAALIEALPSENRPRVIAFGPHVQTARLDAARAAGCDEVLPRSRFSAELPQLLAKVTGGDA